MLMLLLLLELPGSKRGEWGPREQGIQPNHPPLLGGWRGGGW